MPSPGWPRRAIRRRDAAPRFLESICTHLDWQAGELWTESPADGEMSLSAAWQPPAGRRGRRYGLERFTEGQPVVAVCRRRGGAGAASCATGSRAGSRTWLADADFQRGGLAREAGLRRAFALPLRDGADDRVNRVLIFFSADVGTPDPALAATMETLVRQINQFGERCRTQLTLQAVQARLGAFLEHTPGARGHQGRPGPLHVRQPEDGGDVPARGPANCWASSTGTGCPPRSPRRWSPPTRG